MHEYHYTGLFRLGVGLLQLGGLATILFNTLFAAWLILVVLQVNPSAPDTILCLCVWSIVLGWTIGLALMNIFPTVWVDDAGLFISAFLMARIFIPWDELVDVGAGHVPFGNTLVRARRISPFHRVYGWLYSRTLFPSFVISKGIKDYDKLVQEFKRRALMARQQ